MKSMILSLFVSVGVGAFASDCPPPVRQVARTTEFFRCQGDQDCGLLQDACRSCGRPPVALHRGQIRRFEKLDQEIRKRIGCVVSCEACSMRQWKAVCRSGLCQARPADSVPLGH